MQRNRFLRTISVMVLLFILTAAMYAFTADNTVADSRAGIGDGDVSGYDVSDITYTLASGDGSTIASVQFGLNGSAGTVVARGLDDDGEGDWVTCSETATADTWTCPINVSTLDLVSLEVAAAD